MARHWERPNHVCSYHTGGGHVPSVALAARVRPCTIFKFIAYCHKGWILKRYVLQKVCGRICSTRQGEAGEHCKTHHLSLRKLLLQLFYLCAIRSPTYTEPRPTATVLRIRHNALDVLHVGTRAIYGFTHAHECILAEVFRARNCYKIKSKLLTKLLEGGCRRDTGDLSTYDCLRALPTVVGRMAAVVVAGVRTFH